jgi:Domain of unknown function (DUF4105)
LRGLVSRIPVLAFLLCLACSQAHAQSSPKDTEVWLVTYGPGEIYWQRFGHNGIWIRDKDLGLDHVFNFGFFDFAQKGFLQNFLQGRLLYFVAAQPAQQEFSQYINENRSIRVQRLALAPEQALKLADFLVNEAQPANRDYLYDYYWNNCSTRVRDALDSALDGVLHNRFGSLAAEMNMRDQTRRLTVADFWLYLGLELGLGSPVDQRITRWDEFFIPGVLAESIAEMPGATGSQGSGLVLEDTTIYASTLPGPPENVTAWWPRYLLFSAALLVLSYALRRWVPRMKPVLLARCWLALSALLGGSLVYLWFFTDHAVTQSNLNLLLFNPLWLLCLIGRRWYSVTGLLVLAFGGVALLMTLLPPGQYTADLLAACLPLNIAAAWILIKDRRLAVSGSELRK